MIKSFSLRCVIGKGSIKLSEVYKFLVDFRAPQDIPTDFQSE